MSSVGGEEEETQQQQEAPFEDVEALLSLSSLHSRPEGYDHHKQETSRSLQEQDGDDYRGRWEFLKSLPHRLIRDIAFVIASPDLLLDSNELPIVSVAMLGGKVWKWNESKTWLKTLDIQHVIDWFGARKQSTRLGIQDTKLEIHGMNGQFYHAVMHTRCSITGVPSNLEPQTVEFAMANTEYVKQFLFQYSLLRRREGFGIRYDSLSPYPDPIGMDMYFNPNSVPGFYNQPFQQQPYLNPFELASVNPFSGLHAPNNGFIPGQQPLAGQFYMDRSFYGPYGVDQRGMIPNAAPAKPHKSNVAAQRERTGKLKISDLAAYFHLPINVAAKELAICPTVLKKICRRNGMRRWPHRKIKSIERIIMTLEQTIAEGNGEGIESIQSEIAMLKNERAQLCAGFVGEK